MHFSLPLDDEKNAHCLPLHYVEITDDNTDEYIGLFRIIPANTRKLATINEVQYSLEHVLATLLNDVLFKYHQRSNFTTRDNIEYVLSQQTTKHWQLGDCDITRYFHYKWENENGLLGPLFSIAEPFDVPYVWTWDTQSYPWTLNLVTPSEAPTAEIRFGKNLAEIERKVDPSNIVNRLYALGAGEGVNQLDITRVNNGRAYIENTASIAQYGLGQYVWVDRRFEDEASLLASAQAFLDEWSLPRVSYNVKAVDLSSLTGLSIDEFTVGKVVRVVDPEIGTFNARIISEKKADIYGAPGDIDIGLANTKDNVGTTLADVERRQEINEVYSQGATNILNADRVDNADPTHPIRFKIRIPKDAVNVNFMELTWDTDYFRGYTRGSEAGGAYVKSSVVQSKSTAGGGGQTTTSGGGQTTSAGGGQTTSAGGGQTSSAGGDHRHKIGEITTGVIRDSDGAVWTGGRFGSSVTAVRMGAGNASGSYTYFHAPGEYSGTPFSLWTEGSSGSHSHTVANHTHTVAAHTHTVAAHSHEVSDHTHDFEVTIPAINIPSHSHEQIYGIYEHDKLPSNLEIKVDGTIIPHTALSGENVELTPYLRKDNSGKIERDRFAIVEIRPSNELAQINASIIWGLFVRSHKGGDL